MQPFPLSKCFKTLLFFIQVVFFRIVAAGIGWPAIRVLSLWWSSLLSALAAGLIWILSAVIGPWRAWLLLAATAFGLLRALSLWAIRPRGSAIRPGLLRRALPLRPLRCHAFRSITFRCLSATLG